MTPKVRFLLLYLNRQNTYTSLSSTSPMTPSTMDRLVVSRLNDLTKRISYLYENGDRETAAFLAEEGKQLAAFADSDEEFFYVGSMV